MVTCGCGGRAGSTAPDSGPLTSVTPGTRSGAPLEAGTSNAATPESDSGFGAMSDGDAPREASEDAASDAGNPPIPHKAIAVSVGVEAACAIAVGGAVACWGSQFGTTLPSFVPVWVPGLTSGVTSVSVGAGSSCAITATGAVVCWGGNGSDQLGNTSPAPTTMPVQVPGLASGVTSVSMGQASACAVMAAGAVVCWGANDLGQLGNNSTTSSPVPVPVSGLTSGVTAVSVGGDFACAVMAAGAVVCWGANDLGQLGNNSTTSSSVPVPVSGLSDRVTSISAGNGAACALTAANAVLCWGVSLSPTNGPATTFGLVPVPVASLAGAASAVSVGGDSICAITSIGAVECWGGNSDGQLGDGSLVDSAVPVGAGSLSGVTSVSVGAGSACALTENGDILCWGLNDDGQLANETTSITLCGPTSVPCATAPVPVMNF
jgi:alpha-tubulin suppressor-like RCC1 family protein